MNKKVVLITGCSTGIGRALANEFHKNNFRVVATARQLESISDLEEKGIAAYPLDVNNKEQVEQIIKDILQHEKQIDILVNNAGYGLIAPLIELSEKDLLLQFETNVFSTLFITQKIAPSMKQQGYGLIVNIGSISGITPTPFSGAYCASKAALHVLSDVLRMELSSFGIRVITVQPGAIRSNFGESAKIKAIKILKINSWYHLIHDAIISRAEISQVSATPAEIFAKELVTALMLKNPPAVLRIGKFSFLMPLLKQILPTTLLDNIFKKKFGFTGL